MSWPSATTASDCSIADVELARVGTWNAGTGACTITRADLASAVAAAPHLPAIPVRLGHFDPRFSGSPSLGRVVNLRTGEAGDVLLGDLVDLPRWLYDNVSKAYPQRSIEAALDFQHEGRTFRFCLTGLALLGAEWPAVTSLQDIRDLLEK